MKKPALLKRLVQPVFRRQRGGWVPAARREELGVGSVTTSPPLGRPLDVRREQMQVPASFDSFEPLLYFASSSRAPGDPANPGNRINPTRRWALLRTQVKPPQKPRVSCLNTRK